MSLSQELCHKARDQIIERFAMTEIGSPFRVVASQIPPGGPIGEMRIWRGDSVRKLVYIGITVPMMQLDSHMMFAFTPPASAVPHFTLDSVMAGPSFAFHLDLIPRVGLGANLAYMDAAFTPLTEEYEKARKTEGLTEARLSPRQFAIMSPWMLAHRATESGYRAVEPTINFYREHWQKLVRSGLPAGAIRHLSFERLAERDRRNRAIIFNPDVDKVWHQLLPLIGADMSSQMREVLRNQEVEDS